jgi:hypothetical protein
MKAMKESTSSEYEAFKSLLDRIVSVPREELQRRDAQYKKQAALNPSKPGPKPKRRRGAGRVPAA